LLFGAPRSPSLLRASPALAPPPPPLSAASPQVLYVDIGPLSSNCTAPERATPSAESCPTGPLVHDIACSTAKARRKRISARSRPISPDLGSPPACPTAKVCRTEGRDDLACHNTEGARKQRGGGTYRPAANRWLLVPPPPSRRTRPGHVRRLASRAGRCSCTTSRRRAGLRTPGSTCSRRTCPTTTRRGADSLSFSRPLLVSHQSYDHEATPFPSPPLPSPPRLPTRRKR